MPDISGNRTPWAAVPRQQVPVAGYAIALGRCLAGRASHGLHDLVGSCGTLWAHADCGILAAVPPRPRRLWRYLRAHGPRRTSAEVARRARDLFYKRDRWIVLLKDLGTIKDAPSAELRVEDLGASSLQDLSALNRRRARQGVDRRFTHYVEEGFHGFVGYRDDEAVGYYWWVDAGSGARFPDLRDRGLGIELAEKDAYGSDFYVLEEHRGDGIAAAFLTHIETALRDRGYRRLWGYVVSENRPARWVYSTRGYEPMWIITRRRVGLLRRTIREPL